MPSASSAEAAVPNDNARIRTKTKTKTKIKTKTKTRIRIKTKTRIRTKTITRTKTRIKSKTSPIRVKGSNSKQVAAWTSAACSKFSKQWKTARKPHSNASTKWESNSSEASARPLATNGKNFYTEFH